MKSKSENFCIYQFNPNCQEWEDIRNSNLTGGEKDAAFKECVKKIGKKLTLQEYFSIYDRKSDYQKGICYEVIGEPSNILEKLAYSEQEYIAELSYCTLRDSFPEDICEGRTDWDSMREYADGLASFIDRIKDEIGSGKLKYK